MKHHIVLEYQPDERHFRYGEGAVLRAPDGSLLYAYSEFDQDPDDGGRSNIALLHSADEGDTWTYCGVIADAATAFGVQNIMCVSAMPTADGNPCFYFLIKENDGSSTFGRAVSTDGGRQFHAERCGFTAQHGYYVLENDRMIRLSDGRILTAASRHTPGFTQADIVTFESVDDGYSFHSMAEGRIRGTRGRASDTLEEPGLLELPDGRLYVWARTYLGCQYQAYADRKLTEMSDPEPSRFTSPRSPMILKRGSGGVCYAVYNPVPRYNGRRLSRSCYDRTPLILEISRDGGLTWGELYAIETAEEHAFCYPCIFETADHCLLCAYMVENDETCSCDAMRMVKIELD